MKVEFYKSIDVESEVNIDIDDITSALNEALANAKDGFEKEANDRSRAFRVQQFVSAVYQCLAATTDEMIESIKGSGRKAVADVLRKQASRFYEE